MTGFVWRWKLGNVWDGTGMSRLETTVGSAICRPCSESNRTAIPDAWRTFTAWIHPEDKALVGKAVADARRSRKPYAAEFRVVAP